VLQIHGMYRQLQQVSSRINFISYMKTAAACQTPTIFWKNQENPRDYGKKEGSRITQQPCNTHPLGPNRRSQLPGQRFLQPDLSQWLLDYVPQTLVLNLEIMRSVCFFVLFFSGIQVAYFIKFKCARNKQIIIDHKYHGL